MNPLDALSSLTANAGAMNMPVTPTTPTMPGAPVTEGFSQMMGGINGAMPASGISPAAATPSVPSLSGGDAPSTWGHMAQQMVMDVNNQQQTAASMVSDVLKGGPTPVHQALVATEEAGLSFEFLSQVRNKLVDAYQQIMQMQV